MIIRELKIEEINNFIELCELIDEESQNMLYEIGERKLYIEGHKIQISKLVEDDKSNIWVVIQDAKLVGYLIAIGSHIKRIQHVLSITIGVLDQYSNRGVGRKLLQTLLGWANEKKIFRIELTVRSSNKKAIRLYEKFGFVKEGMRKSSMYINSHYEDELFMSKTFL